MATLNETWEGLASGTIERPDQPAILRVLVTRARSTATNPDTKERLKALRVGRVIGGPEAIEIYREYAKDSALEVRREVFERSKELGEAGISAIRAMMDEPDHDLSHQIYAHLFDAADAQSATASRHLLRNDDTHRRAWAALLIGKTAGASMVMRVQPLASDPEPDVAKAAQWALHMLNGQEVGEAPRPSLSTNPSPKTTALVAPESEPEQMATDAPPMHSFETIHEYFGALGEAQDPTELAKHIRTFSDAALSAGLRDCTQGTASPAQRRGAALAAARTGNTRWASHLRRLMRDVNPGVRAAVAEGLGALCTNAVSIPLGQMLQDEHQSVRAAAARGLVVGAPRIQAVPWALGLLRQAAPTTEDAERDPDIDEAIQALEAVAGA